MTCCLNSKIPRDEPPFGSDDWTGEFKNIETELQTGVIPRDWQSTLCADFAWPAFANEHVCSNLKDLEGDERGKHRTAIEIQARSYEDAIWPVQQIIGSCDLPHPRIRTKRLVYLLMQIVVRVVFFVKKEALRRRPVVACEQVELNPMFKKDSPFYPGHPSYPSGHAASAYALAYLYQHMFPKHSNLSQLEKKAQEVAHNREIAGLHFPMDSEAGRLLAGQVIKWIVTTGKLNTAIGAARKEWPASWG